MPHAGSKSTPQSVFETSFIILPWLRMGNTFIPLKVMKVCWMVPGRSVILRDQHLASRVDDCHCRRHPWMKVRKSQMHKDGFSTSFNSSEFLWFWKWSSQCCTSTWSTWLDMLDMLDMWRSSAPRLDPMDPDVFEKWPVRTETRETRYWCNGNECHQIRTYNLLQFATTLRQDWQDEWFLLILLLQIFRLLVFFLSLFLLKSIDVPSFLLNSAGQGREESHALCSCGRSRRDHCCTQGRASWIVEGPGHPTPSHQYCINFNVFIFFALPPWNSDALRAGGTMPCR